MRGARWIRESAIVAVLPSAALFDGAGAPDKVKAEIIERLSRGEQLNRQQVKLIVQSHRKEADEQARLEALDPERRKQVLVRESKKREKELSDSQRQSEMLKKAREEGRLAAIEYVAMLRLQFSDHEFLHLLDLWRKSEVRVVFEQLKRNGQEV